MSPELDPRAHADPETWCQAPLCKDTNWGGYHRLHLRGSKCPSYDPNPGRNRVAEYWEALRESVRHPDEEESR